jgi:hypothetical protein
VRSAILVSLLGSAGASTLKKAGVEIGRRSTAVALERLPARILTEINKRVGFQLVIKTGEKGVLNLAKWVPLVGGPIGAAVDGFSCNGDRHLRIADLRAAAAPRRAGLTPAPADRSRRITCGVIDQHPVPGEAGQRGRGEAAPESRGSPP